MTVLDRINGKFRKNTLHSERMPLSAGWAMKRETMSQLYELDQPPDAVSGCLKRFSPWKYPMKFGLQRWFGLI